MQGPSIVVGIDFGTTFSGIAWALEGSIDDIEILSSWPNGGNRTSVKVPSTISYDGEKIHWGYQIGPLTEACRGIKLLLDEDQITEYPPSIESKTLLSRYGKDVVQVTGDYLRQLVRQVQQVLQRRLGLTTDEMELQFTLTVPAVWSDKAKDATLRAAIQAGVPSLDISLVSEPEAAALYALRAIQPNSVGKNDVFVVCDAGGGTVDLISYQIKNLEPLWLTEVTKGTGGVCGSILLDNRFQELLRQKMGSELYDLLPRKSKEAAITYWQERVKPSFTGKYDEDFADVDYFIPVPGANDDPSIPIEDGFFMLSSDDIEGIFEPIIREIEKLVEQQVTSIGNLGFSTEAIILVGGFGASEYLFHRLQKANHNATILQPPNGWSAVVRYKIGHPDEVDFTDVEHSGAVHRGLEGNRVESRIARHHYGVQYRTLYDRILHRDSDKVWDPIEEEYKVDHRMQWYIKKTAKISENEPIKMDFYRTVGLQNNDKLVFQETLYFCNDEDAPSVCSKRTLKLCELEADLRQIPQELFQRKRNSKGLEYLRIPFVLTMTPTSASLLFELEFNGVSYGSVRTRY